MDGNTDQKNFWLAWGAVCSGADCTDEKIVAARIKELCAANPEFQERLKSVGDDIKGIAKLSFEMNKSLNGKFREAMAYFHNYYKGLRNSDYADEVSNWDDGNPRAGCAFSVLEAELYSNESIKGRPFKEYLMEDVGRRPGTMAANLYGYVKRTVRTIVRNSFSKCVRRVERVDSEGYPIEVGVPSTESCFDYSSLPADVRADVKYVSDCFVEYVVALSTPDEDGPAAWDCDHWISLYCAIHEIPINNPEVRSLCRRSRTAIADIYNKTVENLLLVLRKRYKAGDRAIAWAFGSAIPALLDKRMSAMPFYGELERIRKSRIEETVRRRKSCAGSAYSGCEH